MSNVGEVVKLPIAETFHSIQGEGQWVGTPMFFIRLAGCPVGRPASAVKQAKGPLPLLQTGVTAMACASWDGRGFWCDTDYNTHEQRTVEELVEMAAEKEHICLTGGEPLIHFKKFARLAELCEDRKIMVHVETSGTVVEEDLFGWWITCAPKINCDTKMIEAADELKLLVDARFHPDELTPAMRDHKNVFLCPINDVDEVRMDNVERALNWLTKFPHWRLSCQMHKFLRLR